MSHNATRRPVPGTKAVVTDDGGFLLDAHRTQCFQLNAVGAVIWRALEQGTPEADLVDVLATHYPDVARGDLAADAIAFLADLTAAGLID
jgi:hypothetical protein